MEYEELQELTEKTLELLTAKNFREIKALINDLQPQDSALLLEELNEKDILPVFRLLSKENAAETFVEMSYDSQELLLNTFSDAELKAVFDEMFLDDTVDIIEEMPANVVKRIIKQSDAETRNMINEILKYPKDSAGTIMTVEYVSLRKNMTVQECFNRIRQVAVDKETIYNCYVTDDKRKLIGTVTVKDLLLHEYETPISEFMETDVISVEATDDKEFAAQQISKYDLSALPVVDSENRMVGIVTVDDVLDVMEQEATEDISIMAAVTPSTDTYMEQSVWQIWKNRIPWLLILMISATFTGLIINKFEGNLNALSPLLFACIPMLMDTGGNAGSQASVTVIRGLALDEIRPRDALKVLWKELRVSAMLAACLAVVCFGKLYLLDGLAFGYDYTWYICLAVSLSLFATVVLAKTVGCLMPLLAKACRLDPAVVASPFITTIVDALSLIIFCLISMAILPPFLAAA
ncbi:MAG: magnesium transporter [Clostridiales bacterium]|nr:magnesium transporter [Clostridiales bacterium]